jgi:predicted phosphohydrolase
MRGSGWATDIHLNFVSLPPWDAFIRQLTESRLDALLVTGDISESDDLTWQLHRLACESNLPLYFVLGNHDFYRGSLGAVRERVQNYTAHHPLLHYMTDGLPVRLGDQWVLCGDDGWADAFIGDYFGSPVRLNDFLLIDELRDLDAMTRFRRLRREGVASAVRLLAQLQQASVMAKKVLVICHVPPFRESCWYEHQQSDDQWAPFFVCHGLGWALRRFCRSHPEHQVRVLCGHTHHAGCSQIMENLVVWTGGAQYGEPQLVNVFELPQLEFPAANWSFT